MSPEPRKYWRAFLTALSMLTFFPVPQNFMPEQEDLERAPDFFPLAGLAAAVLAGIPVWLFSCFMSPAFFGVAAVICIFGVSRCFHLDGLADTADGFLSSRPKEKILEIMHDSRIGTMGVFAIVLIVLWDYSAARSLSPLMIAWAVFAGRVSMTFYTAFSHYARKDGLAKHNFTRTPRFGMISGTVLMCLPGIRNPFCLIYPAAMILFAWLWSRYTLRKIGGATGDTTGACCELAAALQLFLFFC